MMHGTMSLKFLLLLCDAAVISCVAGTVWAPNKQVLNDDQRQKAAWKDLCSVNCILFFFQFSVCTLCVETWDVTDKGC